MDENYLKTIEDIQLAEMAKHRLDILKQDLIWYPITEVLEELLLRFRDKLTK